MDILTVFRAVLLSSVLFVSPAIAATVQSYDAVCTSTCVASDGTSQPSGTALYRFGWDGSTPYTPVDSAGNALKATLDVAQSTALYQPVVATTPAPTFSTSTAPIVSYGIGTPGTGGVTTHTIVKADGTSITANDPIGPLVSGISGSITQGGRTLTPVTLSFGTVATGGTSVTMTATDSKSGPANVGDSCTVASGTSTPLPSTMRFQCDITSSGVASITAFPTLGVALASQSVTVNVFWRG